jgi:hypothetical protein
MDVNTKPYFMSIKHIILVLLFGMLFLMSCDTKGTITNDSSTTNEEGKAAGPMIIDGIVQPGAQLSCKGKSAIVQFSINQQALDFDLQLTEVFWVMNESTNEKELNIWMDNSTAAKSEEDTYFVKLILQGVSNPIQKGLFSTEDKEKNVRGWLLKGEQVIHTYSNGKVTIDDYGFSSNVVCGSFDFTDTDGTQLTGYFNTILTSF